METLVQTFEAIDFLTCKDDLLNIGFTIDEIKKAIEDSGNTKESLTDKKGFLNEPKYMKVYEVTKERHQFKVDEYRGEYKKEVLKTGIECRISAQYQGLRHGGIIFHLLKNRFNWFDKFNKKIKELVKPLEGYVRIKDVPNDFDNLTLKEIKELTEGKEVTKTKSLWSLHQMYTGSNYEMYLDTEFGTLYVPIQSLINKDFSLIENRMTTYALSYHDPINLSGYALNHRGRTKEEYKRDKEQDYNNMVKPLESKEALKLKKFLSK